MVFTCMTLSNLVLAIMDRVSILILLLGLLYKGATAQCVSGEKPTEFPFNLDPCFVCVSSDFTGLCGTDDTGCGWGIDPNDPVCFISPVNLCHPDDVPPTIDPFVAGFLGGQPCYVCLNTATQRRCTGADEEICDWLDCTSEIVSVEITEPPVPTENMPVSALPQLPCLPGDVTPVLPGFECLACLNNDSFTVCGGLGYENEACFWRHCDEQVEPMQHCQPGSELETITGIPECNAKCRNNDGELCVERDLFCSFSSTQLDILECVNVLGITVPPTVTVDPCPSQCSPGSKFPVPDAGFIIIAECTHCRNNTTFELCVDSDDCCQFHFDISCVNVTSVTTTMPEPECQPDDVPPVPPSILCYLCLGSNGGACVEGQYCEWKQVDKSLCPVPTESVTTKSPVKSDATIGCQPVTKPEDCPLCLCLNENCVQCSGSGDESCLWQDVYSCNRGKPTTEAPKGGEKKKRFSLTFKVDDCRDIIDNRQHKQEFLENFTTKTMNLIGTMPTEINLSCGSLIAEFTVEDDYLDLETAEQKLNRRIKDGDFRVGVDGTEYTATSFKDITHKKSKEESPFSSFTPLSWFIIAAVAFVLLFGIFIFTAALCCETPGLRNPKEKNIFVLDQDGSYSEDTEPKLTNDDMYEHNIDIGNEYVDDTHM